MKVAVGSKNPVKIESTRLAFEKLWPNKKWDFVGVEVKSGVSDQPMSDQESIKGATNRAKQALKGEDAHFGVGLEGGLHEIKKNLWFDCGWAVVVDKKGNIGVGSTARIQTPNKFMKLIKRGVELGEANDEISGNVNSKQKEGFFGFMTNNSVTRANGYRDGLIFALSRFLHPEVF